MKRKAGCNVRPSLASLVIALAYECLIVMTRSQPSNLRNGESERSVARLAWVEMQLKTFKPTISITHRCLLRSRLATDKYHEDVQSEQLCPDRRFGYHPSGQPPRRDKLVPSDH